MFLSRFRIPPGIENQEDAFISFDAYVRMLEASADDLSCPDFGLRLSNWQGLHTLGPIAVIARNAQTLLGGVEAIARYLYVHSPALKLTLASRTAQTGLTFTLEMTEPGLPDVVQAYEISMAIAVRIIRLLGGPEARPNAISFMHEQQGADAAYREALGCRARFRQTWCGFEDPPAWPTVASTARIRRRDASRRNTLSPITFRQARRCQNVWQSWPAGCCPPANAASMPSRTNSRCTRGPCNVSWSSKACDARI